ncbi:MAG: LysM peptidoglycan-binding domain-containing protein, partial [Gammaproteobacteria bacterium]|nr:LysM peptidoglycan-binding domain-containing protein [Gammaproteobacteria bacterium]
LLLSIALILLLSVAGGLYWYLSYDDGVNPVAIKRPITSPAITTATPEPTETSRIDDKPVADSVIEPVTDPLSNKAPAYKTETNGDITVLIPGHKLRIRKQEQASSAEQSPATNVIRHKVVEGDTLWAICKRYLNNPYLYPQVANLSRIDDPDLIFPGDVVYIESYRGGRQP